MSIFSRGVSGARKLISQRMVLAKPQGSPAASRFSGFNPINGVSRWQVLSGVRERIEGVSIASLGKIAGENRYTRTLLDAAVLLRDGQTKIERLERELAAEKQENIGLRKDKKELAEKADKAEKKAAIDGHTGLLNKVAFFAELAKQIAYGHRHQQEFSLLMLDIDLFKNVNDTYGHPAGDLVIATIAKTLIEMTRTEDYVARYGGEEMSVILPGIGNEHAKFVANKLREAIEALEFELEPLEEPGKKVDVKVTVSIGVATFDLREEVAEKDAPPLSERLVGTADRRLYDAKKGGRNMVVSEDLEQTG